MHQIEQLRIVGQIDAGLGRQVERIVVLFHPRDELFEQHFGFLLVADEVVIDDERGVETARRHLVGLGHQLRRLLDARLAPVDDDDVAKLTLEWADREYCNAPRRIERP